MSTLSLTLVLLFTSLSSEASREISWRDYGQFVSERIGRTIDLYYEPKTSVRFDHCFYLRELVGFSEREPKCFTTGGGSLQTVDLYTLRIPRSRWQYKYRFHSHISNDRQNVEHDDDYVYRIPLRSGNKVRIMQGYNGSFSHKGYSSFSIDFDVPVGTEVVAARSGKVVWLHESSREGGVANRYRGKDNYVLVRHDDGTVARYTHLKYQSVMVGVGDRVRVGDLLALSGNTGYSNAPHLHFHVSKATKANFNRNSSRYHPYAGRTLPTLFKTKKGSRRLIEGKVYEVP